VIYCFVKENDKIKRYESGQLDQPGNEDLVEQGGRYRDLWMCQLLFLLPFIFLIVGMGLIWGANIQFNSVSGGSRQELSDRYALLEDTEECIKDIISILSGTSVPLGDIMELSQEMKEGLSALDSNINFFLTNIDALTVARNALVIFTSIVPVLLAVIGCILLKAERLRALLVIIFLIDVMLILTGSSFIVHGDIDVVSNDVCREFGYSGSMFQLWESSTTDAASHLSNITRQGFVSLIEQTCESWDQLCIGNPNQVCGNFECNQNTISSLENITVVIDSDGTIKSIPDCVSMCKEGQLRGATEAFLSDSQIIININQSMESLQFLEADIYSNTSMSRMKNIFCEGYSDTVTQLNSGFSVLLVGQLLSIAFFFRFGW